MQELAPVTDNASTHLRNALQTITFVKALSTTGDSYTLTPGELQGIETRILRALAEIEREDRERAAVATEMGERA